MGEEDSLYFFCMKINFLFIAKRTNDYSKKECLKVNQEEVRKRLEKELEIPSFKGRLEEKEYSEEEYQQLKKDLENYFNDYVRNVEN